MAFWSEDDPLAAEHAVVAQWIDEAVAFPAADYGRDVELDDTPAGQALLNAADRERRRFVRALLLHMDYWAEQGKAMCRQMLQGQPLSMNIGQQYGFLEPELRRGQAIRGLGRLLRRRLRLEEEDLGVLADWMAQPSVFGDVDVPIGAFVRNVEWHLDSQTLGPEVRRKLRGLADELLSIDNKSIRHHGARLRQLLSSIGDESGGLNERSDPERRIGMAFWSRGGTVKVEPSGGPGA